MSTPTKDCCGLPAPHKEHDIDGLDEEELDEEELAAYAKALGHPARIAILRLLIEKDACICGEIVDELPLAQSTVSQHLKKLKAAGFIRGEVDGPRVCYCIEPRALARFESLVGLLAAPTKSA